VCERRARDFVERSARSNLRTNPKLEATPRLRAELEPRMSVNFSRSLSRLLPRNDALQAGAQDHAPGPQRTRSTPQDFIRHQQVDPVKGSEQPAQTSQDRQTEEAVQELLRALKQLMMTLAKPDEGDQETLKEMLQRFQEWLKEMDAIFLQSAPG